MTKRTLLALPVASVAALCAYSAPTLAHEEVVFITCSGAHAPSFVNLGSVVRIIDRKKGRYTLELLDGDSFDEREGGCTLVRPEDLPIVR